MKVRKITFEFYINFLLKKLVHSYNLKHYPPMDKYELSNQWYKLVNGNNLNYIEVYNFIEYLKEFKSENFIKNFELFDDIILYLEGINSIKVTYKLFQRDIELLNVDEIFKNKNLLKYYNSCKIYYSEVDKIDNLDKFLI